VFLNQNKKKKQKKAEKNTNKKQKNYIAQFQSNISNGQKEVNQKSNIRGPKFNRKNAKKRCQKTMSK
jgi:hypothetical protein